MDRPAARRKGCRGAVHPTRRPSLPNHIPYNAMRTAQVITPPFFPQLTTSLFEQTERTIYKRFLDFHIKYPQVYILFEKFALQLIGNGHKRLGAKMIIERIRWECATGSKDEHDFKINNSFVAHYSRLFIKNNPLYQDCFEFRTIKSL